MLKNLWSRIELVCTNHETPVPMYVYEYAKTPFYACPKYMAKDDAHPNGHEPDERGCANRVSFEDFRHLVEKLGERISADEEIGEFADYTGMRFSWKTLDAVVVSYSTDKIVLGVKNRKEIGTWQ